MKNFELRNLKMIRVLRSKEFFHINMKFLSTRKKPFVILLLKYMSIFSNSLHISI